MNQPSVLIVDDDRDFLQSQSLALNSHFKIVRSETVQSSLQILQDEAIDCALVDYYLNDDNGHEIAAWVARHQPWCPVVLISARVDKAMALNSFACQVFDIFEKPYEINHAVARINEAISLHRERYGKRLQPPWRLDEERRVLHFEGRTVDLTQTETKILQILTAAKGAVVGREKLVRSLWGAAVISENSLDTHLTNLRKKAPFLKSVLKGVRGVGYVLDI
jgi:DNA-binding response OmpR family regulator